VVDINHVKAIVTTNQQDATKLYIYLLEANNKTYPQAEAEQPKHSHAQLMLESMKEIDSIKNEVSKYMRFLKKNTSAPQKASSIAAV